MNTILSKSVIIALGFTLFVAGKCSKNSYDYTAETSIEIVKTACFGSCPVYNFVVKGDGTSEYNGKRFVDLEGTHTRTFSADTTNMIFSRLIEADLWQYKNEYTDEVTDLPTTYLTFKHEGKQKKMKLYFGVPEDLKAISKELEALAFTDGWKATTVVK
jgi:hypothetical protein